MNPAVQSALVSGAFLVLIALITYRQTRKGSAATERLSERVVDRDDFQAVMDRMERDLERSDSRITELEQRLEDEVKARKEADARAVAAEQRAERAEKRATRLERRVTQLENVLRENHIAVPPVYDS